jgi:YHS domain-containing protein
MFLVFWMVIDVVCGMEIDEKTAKWKSEYEGKTYYFCGPMCKLEFDENPKKYSTVNTAKVDK